MRAIVLLCLLSQVLAGPGKPDITIGINSESFGKGAALGAVEPQIKWQTSGTFSGLDVDGGVDLKVKDVGDMPYGIWGRVKGTVRGFNLSARVDTSSKDTSALGLDLQAVAPSGTTVQLTAVADTETPSVMVGNIKVTQKIKTDAGDFVIAPKYNLASSSADVSFSYGRDDTRVTIDANLDKQKITVSQVVGENNMITPSVTSEGDVELSYTRTIGPGALTAAYKPDSHASLTYEDGPWVATVTAPIDGLYKPSEKVKFNIRRSVDVTALGNTL